jgi:hypothetical protein
MLGATVAFELVKDLDFESAALFAWILFGLWWFRADFDADSDPRRLRWGLIVLLIGVSASVLYAVAGTAILQGQLRPEFGVERAFESLLLALSGSPTRYRALTERADWFLTSLPVASYGLILIALTQLLRPVLAPAAFEPWGRLHTCYNGTNVRNGSGSSSAGASPAVMAIAISVVVLAAGAFGYLLTTFLFAFSGGQYRMVPVVNLVAVAVVVSSFVVAAVTWILRSPMHALQWATIGTGIGWLAAIAIEFVLSFSLG